MPPKGRRSLHALKLVRDEPIEFDSQTPAVCPDAENFAKWSESLVRKALADPTHEVLDQALLRLTKEYLHRKARVNHPHLGYICFPDVFESQATKLFEAQMELIRKNGFSVPAAPASPSQTPSGIPLEEDPSALYIGEIEDED
jgi:hypothetical protein